jgi:hypothetical protein
MALQCEARSGRITLSASRVKCPILLAISIRLALFAVLVEAVSRVMFESPCCNASRNKEEIVFRPQGEWALCYCPNGTKLGVGVTHMVGEECVLFESRHCSARQDRGKKLLRPQE